MRVLAERTRASKAGHEFVVAESTLVSDWIVGSNASQEVRSLADAASVRSDVPWLLPDLVWPPSFHRVSSTELSRLFKGRASWRRFFSRYPKAAGVVRFGVPAINASADRAVLGLSFACGFLCGGGELFVLRRSNGEWMVEESIGLWEH